MKKNNLRYLLAAECDSNLNIRLPEVMLILIKTYAKRHGYNASELIRELLVNEFEKPKRGVKA